MDDVRADRCLDDVETSYPWETDGPQVLRRLVRSLPEGPAGERGRARLSLLGLDEVIREQGAAAAAPIALGVRDQALLAGDRALQAHAQRALSLLFRKIGDPAAALEHAVAGLALDDDGLSAVHRCKLRLVTGDALALSGSAEDARQHYRDALAHAGASPTGHLSVIVLNSWAYSELYAGQLASAAALVEQMLDLSTEVDLPLTLPATETVASVLHALGRTREAIDLLVCRLVTADVGEIFNVAECWLSLASIQRQAGVLDEAEASLDAGERITVAHALRPLQVEALGERAELLAARGDHAAAYALHRRFHAESLELRSAASDARARTLHAMFAVDEARRESVRYREMSYRDPLTGLLNRRFADEDLTRRLSRDDDVTVAMIDLDHFKRVNDRCSHEAGDAVLTRLAAILQSTATETGGEDPAYAARLGGEEFLLVLPALDLVTGCAVAETVRRRVAVRDWADLAPGVPVTVSVGVASTVRTTAQVLNRADLLREADRCLYVAKAAGRNQVEPSVRVAAEP